MKTNSTALLGAAIGAGLLWLIKKAKNQPKGAINLDYMSYEEIKKLIDLENRNLIADSHIDFAVGKNNVGFYIVFTHYGITGKDDVTARYITTDTYMKLRTEDNVPVTTEDVAVSGIGAVKRSPRRIWAEVEAAQRAGVDLADKEGYTKSWDTLRKLAKGKIQEEGVKPMEVRYFNQLRRAYKSVAGTDLRPEQSVVRNKYGDVVLIYNDYHLERLTKDAIEEMRDNWWSPNLSNKGAMMQTIADIASGKLKFVWKSNKNKTKRGVEQLVFGRTAPEERKQRISYLASPEKGGVYPEEYAHMLWERTDGQADDTEILDGVLQAILQVPSVGKAIEDCEWEYIKNHTVSEPGMWEDVPF